MTRFAARYPVLFHVTDRAALGAIRRDGLHSAASLCAMHAVDPDARQALLTENRRRYTRIAPLVALRRQGLSDNALRPRLDDAIAPAQWRRFINGLVFFFPTRSPADRLRTREPARDQVVIAHSTQALAEAGIALSWCRFNNGYVDRAPRAAARKRRHDDYQPIAAWTGEAVAEIAAHQMIPPSIPFEVLAR